MSEPDGFEQGRGHVEDICRGQPLIGGPLSPRPDLYQMHRTD